MSEEDLRTELMRVKARESRFKKEANDRIAELEKRLLQYEEEDRSTIESLSAQCNMWEERVGELEKTLADKYKQIKELQKIIGEKNNELLEYKMGKRSQNTDTLSNAVKALFDRFQK